MSSKALRAVAEDISTSLLSGMDGHPSREASSPASIADLLLEELAKAVVALLNEGSTSAHSSDETLDASLQKAEAVVAPLSQGSTTAHTHDEELDARLQKAEAKLDKLLDKLRAGHLDQDEDAISDARSTFPNLKYARPKYENVESVLKYVDQDDDSGGVKLVIMNFND